MNCVAAKHFPCRVVPSLVSHPAYLSVWEKFLHLQESCANWATSIEMTETSHSPKYLKSAPSSDNNKLSQSCLTKTCLRNVKTIQEWNQTRWVCKIMTQLCSFLSGTKLNLFNSMVLMRQWGRCGFEMSLETISINMSCQPWPRENAEPWWMN